MGIKHGNNKNGNINRWDNINGINGIQIFPYMQVPPNGWFRMEKKPSFEMDDDWGYPHDLGNHHMERS